MQIAARSSVNIDSFCKEMSRNFFNLATNCVSNSFQFVRTTDASHCKRVQDVWRILQDQRFIYKGTHRGWYCLNDESFVSNSSIQILKAAKINNSEMIDSLGKRYIYLEEEGYKFKIAPFINEIKRWISSALTLIPNCFLAQSEKYLEDGLEDVSISRPAAKNFHWGIPVPGDDGHLIYVWFDALLGYLDNNAHYTESQSLLETSQRQNAKIPVWSVPDCQIFGKDILKFHVTLFPAILLALNLPLPKKYVVHSHWLIDGQKMSKSLGNAIEPVGIINRVSIDSFRYYLLKRSNLDADSDFSLVELLKIHKNDLVDGLGNTVLRSLNPAFIDNFNSFNVKVNEQVLKLAESSLCAFNSCRFNTVIEYSLQIISELNAYINQTRPWELYKENRTDDLRKCIELILGHLYALSIILFPIMPKKTWHILDLLNVPVENRNIPSLYKEISINPSLKSFQKFEKIAV